MFKDHIIAGVGFNNWQEIYSTKYMQVGATEELKHAHNMYLQFLTTTGVIGFFGFIFFIYSYINYLLTSQYNNRYFNFAILCGLIMFLLHGFVDATFFVKSITRIFWLICGIAQIKFI